MTGNKKSFKLVSLSSKTYSLILSSFDFAVTFLFRIRNKIKITFVMNLLSRLTQTINLKKIRIVAVSKLIGRQVQTMNLKKIRIVITSKLIGKLNTLINIGGTITFNSKAKQRIISNVILKKIRFSFTAILATFFTLGFYDPSALSVMDIETLADLDYIES